MPADGTKWIADLLAAGIGAFVASLIAYRTSYSARKGDHRADYENRGFVLGLERGKAYEQEVGKRTATHEDIENVLREVQLVTEKTETIKAQISTGVWNHQTIWLQQRDLYAELLEALKECRYLLASVGAMQQSIFDNRETFMKMMAVVTGLKRLQSLSRIFLGPEANSALKKWVFTADFVKKMKDNELQQSFTQLENEMVAAARKDLGLTE